MESTVLQVKNLSVKLQLTPVFTNIITQPPSLELESAHYTESDAAKVRELTNREYFTISYISNLL